MSNCSKIKRGNRVFKDFVKKGGSIRDENKIQLLTIKFYERIRSAQKDYLNF